MSGLAFSVAPIKVVCVEICLFAIFLFFFLIRLVAWSLSPYTSTKDWVVTFFSGRGCEMVRVDWTPSRASECRRRRAITVGVRPTDTTQRRLPVISHLQASISPAVGLAA